MPFDTPSVRRLVAASALVFSSAVIAGPGGDGAGWVVPPPTAAASSRIVVQMRPGIEAAEAAGLLREAAAGRGGPPSSVTPLLRNRTGGRPQEGRLAQRSRRAPSGLRGATLAGSYVLETAHGRGQEDVLRRLAKDPRVEYAQPDHAYEVQFVPDSPFWSSAGTWGQPYDDLWALKKLGLEQAWDITRGEGALVAVLDSGIDVNHGDFFDRIWQDPTLPLFDQEPVIDRYGHGTHIAGIIAAARPGGGGLVGVAPEARLMPVKVVDDAGRSSSSRIAAGIVYAVDHGADVAVLASACAARCPTDPVVEQAVRYATGAGMLLVVAAGNKGDDVAFYSPQNMVDPKPLVVSATTHLDTRASFSNHGDLLDLAAPGGGTNTQPPSLEPVLNILSTKSDLCSPLVCPPGLVVTGGVGQLPIYLRRAGTSMAAAHVTGVAALLLSAEPDLSLDALRRRLLGNALDRGPAGHDAMFGSGRLTALGALQDVSPFVLARITAPAANQKVSGAVRILGAAAARTFARYELTVGAGASPTTWESTGLTVVGEPTAHGDLGTWTTESVADGAWTLRLVVFDASGARREVRRTVTVDNASVKRELVIDVASESEGLGSVHLSAPRAYCDGAAGATQSCSYLLDRGATVTLTAVPDPLSVFGGWTGACTGTAPCTLAMGELRHVRATFRGPRRLVLVLRQIRGGAGHMVVDPGGRVCNPGESCTFRYRIGTPLRIEAFPVDPPALPGGTHFTWDPGQVCDSLVCNLVLNDHLTLRGTFEEEPEDLQASVCCAQTVEQGTPAYLIANGGSADSRVVHWQWQELIQNPDGTFRLEVLEEGTGEPFFVEFFLQTPTVGVRNIGFAVDDDLGRHAEAYVQVTVVPPGTLRPQGPARNGGAR